MIADMPKPGDESLEEFVARVMNEKNLTARDVQKNSGDAIEQSTVNKIKNGVITNPSIPKQKALAKGLGVTEAELFAVTLAKETDTSEVMNEKLEKISLKFNALPVTKQARLEMLFDMLDREIERIEKEKEQDT